ncbi:helix-turn-helix domain-containing protein [Paenibacillus campi]|uniref:helix-turn-helix domain-containing protein n=1 Tax=Paenibacillus campi TaxID=3106031 RepID=UPI002AFFD430|nr:helix-turn-helix domain-containing protein [Paenibacillus sp. SGZ-1014]
MPNVTPDSIRLIMNMMQIEFQMTMYWVDAAGQLVEEQPLRSFNPVYDHKGETLGLLAQRMNGNYPVVQSTNVLEQYLTVPLLDEDAYIGTMIAGPFFHAIVPDELISGIIRDYQLSFRQQDAIRQFYTRIPLISKERIYNATAMIHYMLYQQPLDLAEVIQHNLHIHIEPDAQVAIVSSPYEEEAYSAPASYHRNPEMEQIFLQYIREGRKEDLVRWELGFPTEKLGVLSKKSLLRSEKNLAICSITLATRAAMGGGVNAEIGYTLSDFYIQAVEECQNPGAVQSMLRRCYNDFVDRVRESQQKRYAREVNLCRHYIFQHLYEPIQLEHLSELTGLNGDYLSKRFKNETGLSPVHFIQYYRIQEAKRLMSSTTHSLSAIATMLQFHDQSYFTKIFKAHTGQTPKQYLSATSGGNLPLARV